MTRQLGDRWQCDKHRTSDDKSQPQSNHNPKPADSFSPSWLSLFKTTQQNLKSKNLSLNRWMKRSIWLRTDHSAEIVVHVWRHALLVVHARKEVDRCPVGVSPSWHKKNSAKRWATHIWVRNQWRQQQRTVPSDTSAPSVWTWCGGQRLRSADVCLHWRQLSCTGHSAPSRCQHDNHDYNNNNSTLIFTPVATEATGTWQGRRYAGSPPPLLTKVGSEITANPVPESETFGAWITSLQNAENEADLPLLLGIQKLKGFQLPPLSDQGLCSWTRWLALYARGHPIYFWPGNAHGTIRQQSWSRNLEGGLPTSHHGRLEGDHILVPAVISGFAKGELTWSPFRTRSQPACPL